MEQPRNTLLFFPYANSHNERPSLFRRFTAFSFDLFLIFLLRRAVLISAILYVNTYYLHLSPQEQSWMVLKLQILDAILDPFLFLTYFFLSYSLGDGQTPGTLFCNFKVYSESEQEKKSISALSASLRTIGHFMTLVFLAVPALLPLLRKDGKGLPELISRTILVNNSRAQQDSLPETEQEKIDRDQAA